MNFFVRGLIFAIFFQKFIELVVFKINISKTSSGHPIFLCIYEISIKFGLRKSWFKNIFMVIFYGRQPP